MPSAPPGMSPAEIQKAVLPHLPQELFPGGGRASWWMKSVQLDLQANLHWSAIPSAQSFARCLRQSALQVSFLIASVDKP
jgi:hypothetical protein